MVQAIILAAGESSRFRPLSEGKHKSLVKLLGKTILEHTVDAVKGAGVKDILVVVSSHDKAEIEHMLGKKVEIVVQQEPRGMGDAILACEKRINSGFVVLNADRFDSSGVIKQILSTAKSKKADMVVLSRKTDTPWKYGMLTTKNGMAKKVTEKPKQGTEPSNDMVVGIYLLPKDFLHYYKQCKEHQYAYEDALSLYMSKHDVPVIPLETAERSSAKYSWELLDVAAALLQKALRKKTDIDPSAKIAKSAIVEGPVHIGKNSRIFENAVVKGGVWIGDNCTVGNSALIRENSVIENNCSIGMGTEVARSVFLENSSIHSGFVGDSVVGEGVKIGAGFITANRRLDRGEILPTVKGEKVSTKKTYLGAVIGHKTSVGIMSSTMPGTIIGCNCIIGSNTHLKGTIDSDMIIYSQTEQIVRKRKKEE